MQKKLILLTFTLAFVLVTLQTASAAGEGINSSRPCQNSSLSTNWVPLAEELKLSDQQAQQLKELNLNTYQATKNLKTKLQDAKFELRQMELSKTTAKTAANAKIKEINNLKAQLHQIRQQKRQKVQSILTPEQQSKLKTIRGSGHHGGRCMEGSYH